MRPSSLMQLVSIRPAAYNPGELPSNQESCMTSWRRPLLTAGFTLAAMACMSIAVGARQKDDKGNKDKDSDKRPKLTLKAQPMISIAPSKVVLRAELVGGANDYEDFYCPTVEWDWGDGTHSESTADCEPYQQAKSEIRRRYTVEHVFREGRYQVAVRLKRRDRTVAAATAYVQVQGGAGEFER
jgi:hypothetical protein